MAPRFFCEKLGGERAVLAGDEFHHLRAVRRLGPGDEVELFDGRGRLAVCTVARIGKREAELEVREVRDGAPPRVQLTLATAIPKGERMDWLVEKATELGVWALWPLVTERSVVKDAGATKHAGWKRRVIEASKQCGRLWVPEVSPPMPLSGAALALREAASSRGTVTYDLALLADPSAEASPVLEVLRRAGYAVPSAGRPPIPMRASRASQGPPLRESRETASPGAASGAEPFRIVGFVGPEGGFTDEESAALRSAGAVPVRLGEHILRIETAAVSLCAAVGGTVAAT